MANDTAMLLGTRYHNPATGKLERTEYKWEGKSRYVRIHHGLIEELEWLEPDKKLKIGPYTLVVIEDEFWTGTYYCRRIDNALSWLPIFWYRTNRILDIAYRRFIVTLAVWGLAKYDGTAIPNASQIYLVQKVRKLWQMIIAH